MLFFPPPHELKHTHAPAPCSLLPTANIKHIHTGPENELLPR